MTGSRVGWIARRLPAYVVGGALMFIAFIVWFYPLGYPTSPDHVGAVSAIEFVFGLQYVRTGFYNGVLVFITGVSILYFTTENPRFGLSTVVVANTVLAAGSLRTQVYPYSLEAFSLVSVFLLSLTLVLTDVQNYDGDTWTAIQLNWDTAPVNKWLLLGKGAGYAVCAICLLFTVFILIPVEYPFSPQPSPTPGIAYLTATGSSYANAQSTLRVAMILLVWAASIGYMVRFERLKWLTAMTVPISLAGTTIVHYDDHLTYAVFSTAVLLVVSLLGIRLHHDLLND